MTNYYLHNGKVQTGPFSIEELREKKITSDTLVWIDSLPGWTPAYQVDELKSLFPSIPPPLIVSEGVLLNKKILKNKVWFWISAVIVMLVGAWYIYKSVEQHKQEKIELEDVKQRNQELTDKVDEQARAEDEKKQQEAVNTARNMEYRNNWPKYIGKGNINYKASSLGGVAPFGIPIINNTAYTLDEVTVTVDFIKEGGGIYKTQTLTIYNIPPQSSKTGTTTASPRGTSADITIKGIISKRMHFCYPFDNGNTADPYFCK